MRKLATAAAVSLVLNTGIVYGLGLGDIEMHSALNQPMNAEIRLTSVKSGEAEGMIVQLASPDAFARAGIERSSALTDLTFSVDSSSGTPVIRINSKQAVVEPFLNFLLEVDWPQGRMVREYTVLLDPPVFMTQSETTTRDASADQPAVVERGEQAMVTPVPIERNTDDVLVDGFDVEIVGSAEELLESSDGETVSPGSLATPDEGEVVALTDLTAPNTDAVAEVAAGDEIELSDDLFEVELVGGSEEISDDFVVAGPGSETTDVASPEGEVVALDEGEVVALDEGETVSLDVLDSTDDASGEMTVKRGDTLFEIAQDNGASDVSVQQMMMALLAANQSAFIDGNINLVKAGAILRVPEVAEAQAMSQKQALAAIVQQNQLWQEYRENLQQDKASTRVADAETGSASTDTAADAGEAGNDATASDADSAENLSDNTDEILENARNEVANRDELKIVADTDTSVSSASATSDTDDARLGEINRKLQMAREELTASRLESGELDDRTGELTSTTENLDALVTLRQNEVSQLEAQLADARTEAAEAAKVAEAEAEAAKVAEAEAEAAKAEAAKVEEAEDEAARVAEADLADAAKVAEAEVAEAARVAEAEVAESEAADGDATGAVIADAASDVAGDATTDISEATDAVGDAVTNASDALDSDAAGDDSATDTVDQAPVKQTAWYKDILNDPKRLAIAGVGGVGLLGILGTLAFRRKRPVDELEMDDGAVQYIDDEAVAQLQTEVDLPADDTIDGTAAAGAAAIAGGVALAVDADDEPAVSSATLEAFDAENQTQDWGSETQAVADATSDDGLDKDDTISEVDVYLAYGLHGQAEELLSKAIERKPAHPEYVQKLLQTYHAQGNAEGFHKTAQDFHNKFGGESNPDWSAIAAMGQELRPNDTLYASATGTVASVGIGDFDAPKMQADDFASVGDTSTAGSISRGDFSSRDATLDVSGDETGLMDQSLDPAYAFDEGDLEATGDFSQIANELAQEDGSLDFTEPGVSTGTMGAAVAGAAGLGGLAAAVSQGKADALATGDDTLQDALSLDGFDIASGGAESGAANESLDFGATANDLTLDLDQLSGEMELDGTEMLDDSVSDLEIPDLTADNDLLLSGDVGTSADEMDTMMDLAKAYIDMGDKDSASSALGEIVKGGSLEQKFEAETLLRKIS